MSIRRRTREEREASGGRTHGQSLPHLEESTDSKFTITYDEVRGSPDHISEEDDGLTRSEDESLDRMAEEERQGETSAEGKRKRLSPQQMCRRKSLALNRKTRPNGQ